MRTLVYLDDTCEAYYKRNKDRINLSEILREQLMDMYLGEINGVTEPATSDN